MEKTVVKEVSVTLLEKIMMTAKQTDPATPNFWSIVIPGSVYGGNHITKGCVDSKG